MLWAEVGHQYLTDGTWQLIQQPTGFLRQRYRAIELHINAQGMGAIVMSAQSLEGEGRSLWRHGCKCIAVRAGHAGFDLEP